MLDNIIACTGYEDPFNLMLDGFKQTLKEDDFILLFKEMNKKIIELTEEVELLSSQVKPVIEITESK